MVELILKSFIFYLIHNDWAQQEAAITYPSLVVDKSIEFCFLEAQEIKEEQRKCSTPEVLFLFTKYPT